MDASTVGWRLKLVRGERKQSEFASILGIHKETLGKYERGERAAGLDIFARLCSYEDVNLNWLLTGEGPMRKGQTAFNPAEPGGPRPTDPDLMGRIIDTIRAVHKARGWHVSDRALGERAARWYDEIVSAAADPADRLDLLAQLQLDLGKELRRADADPACSKRPA